MAGSPVKARSLSPDVTRGGPFLLSEGAVLAALDTHPHVSHEGIEVFSNTGTEADLRSELRLEPAPIATDAGDAEPIVAKSEPAEEGERVKGKDAKPRIDKLTYEAREAQRERDEAKAEAAKLRDELGRFKTKPETDPEPKAAAKADEDPEPQEDAFESYGQYVKAQARWEARQEFREQQAKLETQRREEARAHSAEARHRQFATRVQEAVAKDASLADLLGSADVQIHDAGPMPDVITSSPVGVEMMRYLAEHPDEAARLTAMPRSIALYGEMKKLETKIELRQDAAPAGSAPVVKKATKAHPPMKPVEGSHVAVKDDGPPGDDASDDEHYAFWNNPANRSKYGR